MTVPPTLSLPSLALDGVAVTSLEGHEALGRPFRFEVAFDAPGLDAATAVGAPAELRLGTRSVRGVVLALSSGERGDHRATLAPRAALLSLGRRTRSFERATATEVVAAVVAESGIGLSVLDHTREHCPRRAWTVQQGESDLDLVLRLLEREGLTARFDDDGTVVLSDDNAAFPDRGELRGIEGFRHESRLLPSRVDLFGPALTASAPVSPTGVGALEIHDEPFATEAEGERAAQLIAERLRCGATVATGAVLAPFDGAGSAPALGRAQLGQHALLIVSLHHRLHDGEVRTELTAIPERVRFRPERRAHEPLGHVGSRLAAAERAVVSTAAGATLELSGLPAPSFGELAGSFADRGEQPIPAVAHHSSGASDETTTTDTWLRFGVPHSLDGESTRTWSYLRVGEAATTTPLSVTIGDDSATFSESESQCLALELNGYSATGVAGVFDFTDKNRTVLTKGNWEEIVSGEGRLAVHGGNDDPNYELRVKTNRVDTTIKTPVYSFTDGVQFAFFNGFKMETSLGTKVDTALGGKLGFDLGVLLNLTAGYKMDFVFADSFTFRRGEDLSSASTFDSRASNAIQLSIHDGFGSPGWMTAAAAGTAVAATAVLAGVGAAMDLGDVESAVMTGVSAAAMGALLVAARATSKERELEDGNPILSLDKTKKFAVLRSDDWVMMLSPDFALLGKNKPYADVVEVAALKKADAGTALVIEEGNKLTLQAGGAADSMATLVFDKKGITITADTIEIKGTSADSTVTITGPVTIDGDVTLKKKLTVTGETTLSAKTTVKGTEINP